MKKILILFAITALLFASVNESKAAVVVAGRRHGEVIVAGRGGFHNGFHNNTVVVGNGFHTGFTGFHTPLFVSPFGFGFHTGFVSPFGFGFNGYGTGFNTFVGPTFVAPPTPITVVNPDGSISTFFR